MDLSTVTEVVRSPLIRRERNGATVTPFSPAARGCSRTSNHICGG